MNIEFRPPVAFNTPTQRHNMEYPDIENCKTVYLPVIRPHQLISNTELITALLTPNPVYAGFAFGSGSLTHECTALKIVDVEEYYGQVFIMGEFTNTRAAQHLRNLIAENRNIELCIYGHLDFRPREETRAVVDFVEIRLIPDTSN